VLGIADRDRFSTQREKDSESGTMQFRARNYDPRTGRFTQTDPIVGRRATSHYAYAANNPVSMIDPMGTQERPSSALEQERRLHPESYGGQGSINLVPDPNAQPEPPDPAIMRAQMVKVIKALGWEPQFKEVKLVGMKQPGGFITDPKQVLTQLDAHLDEVNEIILGINIRHPTPLQLALVGASLLLHVGGGMLAEEENVVANAIKRGERPPTGAFNPAFKGTGPGLGMLAGREIDVSEKGLKIVEEHLAKFGTASENSMMLDRLRAALKTGEKITGADASFYLHEAAEATMVKHLVSKGMKFEEAYEVAHAGALSKYGVSPFSVYHPEVIKALPDVFNENWFKFWGITK